MCPANATEHHQYEEGAGNVERAHQLRQRAERGNAVLPDGEGQRTKRTDRSKAHQVAEDAEDHGGGSFQHIEYRLALVAHGRQGKAAEHGDEQHRQHLTLVERTDESVRNDVHEKVHHAQLGRRGGVLAEALGTQGGGIDVHALPRPEQVHRRQTDHQADHRQSQEQQQCLAHQAPQGALVGHAGDAGDDGAEHHRGNHHLDQLDECVAQGFERNGLLCPEMPDHYAQQDGAEDLEVQ
ncbi:hypothetical protein D3C76_1002210 [compost metagenome]